MPRIRIEIKEIRARGNKLESWFCDSWTSYNKIWTHCGYRLSVARCI